MSQFPRFRVIKAFHNEGSSYVVDGLYTIREGNVHLAELAEVWIVEGKIVWHDNEGRALGNMSFRSGAAGFTGTAQVTEGVK